MSSRLSRKQIEDLKNDRQEKFIKGKVIKKENYIKDTKIRD